MGTRYYKAKETKMATAYGYDPDKGFSGPELGGVYSIDWPEGLAAQDITDRYIDEYGIEPIMIRVETVIEYRP